MASVPVPNCIMVEMFYQTPADNVEITFHVATAGVPTLANCQAVRVICDAWHLNNQRAGMSNVYVLVGIKAWSLAGPGAPVEDYTLPVARAGTAGVGVMPMQVAACIRLQTGLGGRSYRGRIYHPGLQTGQLGSNMRLLVANADSFTTMYNALKTQLATGGFTLSVASKYSGIDANGRPIPRVVGFLTPVTSVGCRTLLATQRRRLPRL